MPTAVSQPNTRQTNALYPYSLKALGIVDAPPEEAFDNLTALVQASVGAPVSLVSIVEPENDRQYFKSQQGLPEPWSTDRQTPLSHSFCQHVVRKNSPLVVADAPHHSLVCENLAIRDLNVIAYLGVPIYDPSNTPIGALCVIDGSPREWLDSEIAIVKQVASCVSDAIRLKAAVMTSEALRDEQREFTYAISHDLKAPANTLQLLLGELSEAEPIVCDQDASQLIDLSLQTVARMGQQVQDVLGYVRVIGSETETEEVDLQKLLEEILSDLKSDIEEREAIVRVEQLPTVTGNSMQLRVLFQNLISNAIKFRKEDEVPRVRVGSQVDSKSVRISVTDNGIGIPAEHYEKVFRMFQRLHVREKYPGTGLGLSLCRRICQNHGGSIQVESHIGEGTQFTVQLPRTTDQ